MDGGDGLLGLLHRSLPELMEIPGIGPVKAVQLLCIGVLGGYIGKIYSEVKARPRYRIEEFLP